MFYFSCYIALLLLGTFFEMRAETSPKFAPVPFGNKYAAFWGVPYRTLSISKTGAWFMPTDNGLWKTTNGGRSWSLSGFEGQECMAVYATDKVVLASVLRPGIDRLSDLYYSNDMGKSWSKSVTPFSKANGGIWVTMFSRYEDTLFAVTYKQFSRLDTTFLCYSVSSGQRWDTLRSYTRYEAHPRFDFTNTEMPLTIKYTPLPDQRLSVTPILKRNNEWVDLPVFPYPQSSDRRVIALSSPWNTVMLTARQGLFELQGNEWVQNSGIPGIGRTFAFDRKGRIFCAWQENYYYEDVDTTGGLMISADSGRTWRQAASPLGGQLRTITFSGDTVIGFTARGWIIRSTDDGNTWQRADTGIVSYSVTNITFNNGHIYTAGWYGTGLWRGPEEGKNGKWRYLGCDDCYSIKSVAVSRNGTILTVCRRSLTGERGAMQELRRSTDDGKTWEVTPDVWAVPFKFFTHPNGDIFASGNNIYTGGLCRSTDDGATWIRVDTTILDNYCVLADSTIIIGYRDIQGYSHVKVSHDYGRTWSVVPLVTEKMFRDITFLEYINGRVFLYATQEMAQWRGADLLYSDDRGHTWQRSQNGSEKYLQILTADSTDRIFATSGSYLHVSNDKGVTWQTLDSVGQILGGNAPVYSLATSPRGYIYVGTYYSGLYRSTQRFPPVSVQEEQLVGAINELPLRIVPNPAAESFTVHCPDNSAVTVKDVFGRIVLTGVGRETFPTYNISSGVYFVEVAGADGRRVVEKVVVSR